MNSGPITTIAEIDDYLRSLPGLALAEVVSHAGRGEVFLTVWSADEFSFPSDLQEAIAPRIAAGTVWAMQWRRARTWHWVRGWWRRRGKGLFVMSHTTTFFAGV